jgi:ATP synthase protein I
MTKLDDLDAKLDAAKARYEQQNPTAPAKYSREMNLGIRAFMEMFGVLLGSGLMGWALDAYFKTSPTLLIIFVILGIVAAFFNLYKLSKDLGTAIGSNNLQSEEKAARKPSQNESD